jgi:hypothetical protein
LAQRQHETVIEILCEVALQTRRIQGVCRPIPISTESLIRSAVLATPNLDLIAVAVLATVL